MEYTNTSQKLIVTEHLYMTGNIATSQINAEKYLK